MINYNEIDKGFRPIIKALNDKGWKTKFCCEGHYDKYKQRYVYAYIYFDAPIPKALQPLFETYPRVDEKMWCKQMRQSKHAYSWVNKEENTFYWVGDGYKKNFDKQDELHKEFLNLVQKWVDKLPYK